MLGSDTSDRGLIVRIYKVKEQRIEKTTQLRWAIDLKRREHTKNVVAIPCFVLSWKQEEKSTDRMFTLLVKVK